MKFLCDHMLSELGKWLRAAGYDTVIATENEKDSEILKKAIKEGRILLTRDRHFLTMNHDHAQLVYFSGNSTEECVKELNAKLKINWLYRPLSRCMICNGLLDDATKEQIAEHVPEGVRAWASQYWYCSRCNKVYWEGAHVEKIRKQLQTWDKIS